MHGNRGQDQADDHDDRPGHDRRQEAVDRLAQQAPVTGLTADLSDKAQVAAVIADSDLVAPDATDLFQLSARV